MTGDKKQSRSGPPNRQPPPALPEERDLPCNLEAERLTLGAALNDPKALDQVVSLLKAEDYYLQKHRTIYQAILDLQSRKEAVDRVTLANQLITKGQLESVDGLTYLVTLDEGGPLALNAEAYAKIVREKSQLRKVLFALHRHSEMIYEPGGTPDLVISSAHGVLTGIAAGSGITHTPSTKEIVEAFPDGINAFLNPKQIFKSLQTGYPRLDRLWLGPRSGKLYVIGGGTGTGKSILASNIAYHVAKTQGPVQFFTLEMSQQDMMHRMLCSIAVVSYTKLVNGWLNQDDRSRIQKALVELVAAPMHLDDTARLTIHDVASRCRSLHFKTPLSLVVIDYLQWLSLRDNGRGQRYKDDNEALTDIMGELGALAKLLDIPILIVSQFNRDRRSRGKQDQRPIISDLHGSGAIDKDSSGIAMIYRESLDNPGKEELKGKAELIVRKSRFGENGTIYMRFEGAHSRFFEDEDDKRNPVIHDLSPLK